MSERILGWVKSSFTSAPFLMYLAKFSLTSFQNREIFNIWIYHSLWLEKVYFRMISYLFPLSCPVSISNQHMSQFQKQNKQNTIISGGNVREG